MAIVKFEGVLEIDMVDFWTWLSQEHKVDIDPVRRPLVEWGSGILSIRAEGESEASEIDQADFWGWVSRHVPVGGESLEYAYGQPKFDLSSAACIRIGFACSNTDDPRTWTPAAKCLEESVGAKAEATDEPAFSETLEALLRFTKSEDFDASVAAVEKALYPIYGCKMTLRNVVHLVLKSYVEAASEPRFEIGRGDWVERVLLAPVSGPSSVELLGPASLETKYTVAQFYGAVLLELLCALRLTNVGWRLKNGEAA